MARKYEKSQDELIVIAGACQSNYEELINSGANFASSPKRVNIHALDPAIIAISIAKTERPIPKMQPKTRATNIKTQRKATFWFKVSTYSKKMSVGSISIWGRLRREKSAKTSATAATMYDISPDTDILLISLGSLFFLTNVDSLSIKSFLNM